MGIIMLYSLSYKKQKITPLNIEMFIPNLVENNIKGIVKLNLKECHDLKMKYYEYFFLM